MNRIDKAFAEKKDLLSIYYTAGYPELDDTLRIANALEQGGADIIEIGLPYSDPIADGPTIQESSTKAIKNGFTLNLLFEQLADLRSQVKIPVILMGYLNPVMQYGIERFCEKCQEVGVDGLILPDLPMQEYLEEYQTIFDRYGLFNTFLITPQTTEERIRLIDSNSEGFIYMVSSASITGAKEGFQSGQLEYFDRIKKLNLSSKRMIGFGISDHETYSTACKFADGAIIGSAFIKKLTEDASDESVHHFIKSIKG